MKQKAYPMLLIGFCLHQVFAQVPQGQIVGLVSESSGALVTRAKVVLDHDLTGVKEESSTNESGLYVFSYLNSGKYSLTVEAPGFKTSLFRGIEVQAGEKKRVDIQLQLGEISTKVDVTGSVTRLDTESATVGSMVSHAEVANLPLNGRNFSQLAVLEPGVQNVGTLGGAIGLNLSNSIRIGGTAASKNSYSIDGIDNTLNWHDGAAMNPSVDSIQEFRIDRSVASAEYGRGGAQLQVVTRSGSNQFHGMLWEYFRNYQLNGGNYITHQPDFLKRNQFGGNLGGPILKNRLFFFFNEESQLQRQNYQLLGTVFTDRMRAGDLSEIPRADIIDPGSGAPFPNKAIPSNRLDPYMISYMNAVIPRANLPGIASNLLRVGATSDDWDQYILRLDYRFSNKDSIFVRGATQPRSGLLQPGQVAIETTAQDLRFNSIGGGWIHVWTPRITSETRFASIPVKTNVSVPPEDPVPAQNILGFGPQPIDHVPQISFANYATAGLGFVPYHIYFYDQEFAQNGTFARGSHLIKTGFTVRWLAIVNSVRATHTSWPSLTFQNTYTGIDAGDYLLGLPTNGTATLAGPVRRPYYSDWSGFAQDEWKIKPNLSFSLGLRYDLRTQFVESSNIWATFDPDSSKVVMAGNTIDNPVANPYAFAAYKSYFVPATQTKLPVRSLTYGDHNNFSPRVGIAWRPFKDNQTVVRVGYGIFYILPQSNTLGDQQSNIPFAASINVVNTRPAPTLTAYNFFGAGTFPVVPSLTIRDPHNRDSYLQQLVVGIQRELPGAMVAEINLHDQHGVKLEQSYYDLNQPVPGPGAIQQRRTWVNYTNIQEEVNAGFSRYRAMEASLRKSSAHYVWQVSFVWAKEITSGPVIDPRQSNLFNGPQNYVPRQFKFHSLLDLPVGYGHRLLNRRGLVDAVVGGWTLSAIAIPYTAGGPLTVTWSGDVANVGVNTVRPIRISSGAVSHPTAAQWFDTSAFVAPAPYTFGNSGTGILFAPSSFSADLALHKNFSVRESLKLQLRSEYFNVFNHPNLGSPGTIANGFNFGVIATKNQVPRVIQLALRFTF